MNYRSVFLKTQKQVKPSSPALPLIIGSPNVEGCLDRSLGPGLTWGL